MKKSLTYDVAIIGGGLAGLALAIQLGKAGCKVILFEKEKYPFHKVCGEYISMESWDFLESLGVPLSQMNLPLINELHVTSPSGNMLSHKLDLGGFGISRYTLDFMLVQIAQSMGVIIQQDCKVLDVQQHLVQTNHGVFTAKYIVGSWGKRSRMDVSLVRNFLQPNKRSLNNYVGVKYHVKANLPNNVIELHNFKNGYCGISQIEDGKFCICYLVSGDELKKAGNIEQLEQNVLSQNPFLKKYLMQFPRLYEKPLSISQISFESKTQREEDILMIGDAAGLITPLCGNGMSMAMHASKLLATELFAVFEEKQTYEQACQNYINQWNVHFAKRLKAGRFIQLLFGNKLTTNLVIAAIKPFPFLLNVLVKQTHGKPF